MLFQKATVRGLSDKAHRKKKETSSIRTLYLTTYLSRYRKMVLITDVDKRHLTFAVRLHKKEPHLDADGLIRRMENETGLVPSELVVGIIHQLVNLKIESPEMMDLTRRLESLGCA